MAKRGVRVRVGDDLVRGDTLVGIGVSDPRYHHETFKIMLKVTGHRDLLWLDSGSSTTARGRGASRSPRSQTPSSTRSRAVRRCRPTP
ncbi:hypothetical protein ACFV4X_27580 [Streptomyces ardesiacus]|uniref:hypothetical protein n=1 Tax=Streptomyces ardesiacus TaxID=285564 RepID=UPI003656848B